MDGTTTKVNSFRVSRCWRDTRPVIVPMKTDSHRIRGSRCDAGNCIIGYVGRCVRTNSRRINLTRTSATKGGYGYDAPSGRAKLERPRSWLTACNLPCRHQLYVRAIGRVLRTSALVPSTRQRPSTRLLIKTGNKDVTIHNASRLAYRYISTRGVTSGRGRAIRNCHCRAGYLKLTSRPSSLPDGVTVNCNLFAAPCETATSKVELAWNVAS